MRERLRSALEARPIGMQAMPFVEAVVIQRAWPLGDDAAESAPGTSPGLALGRSSDSQPGAPGETRVATQVIRIIDGSTGSDTTVASVVAELTDDLALLAAFFQNLDLLPADGGPHVDAIALVTAAALQRLADTLSEG